MSPDKLGAGARAAALVSQMAVLTVVAGGLGFVLDREFGSEPWGKVAGFVVGFAAGTAAMLKGLLGTRADDEPPADPPK